MPASADPYEALLEDDELRARVAPTRSRSRPRPRDVRGHRVRVPRGVPQRVLLPRVVGGRPRELLPLQRRRAGRGGAGAGDACCEARRRAVARDARGGRARGRGVRGRLVLQRGVPRAGTARVRVRRAQGAGSPARREVRQQGFPARRLSEAGDVRVDRGGAGRDVYTRAAASKGGGRRRATTKAREKESGFFSPTPRIAGNCPRRSSGPTSWRRRAWSARRSRTATPR